MQSIERMKNSVYLRAKIQNDYLQASHITAIFTCYWAYNAYFKLQKKDMSLKLNKPHNIRGVVSYKRSFPDLNDAHLKSLKDRY